VEGDVALRDLDAVDHNRFVRGGGHAWKALIDEVDVRARDVDGARVRGSRRRKQDEAERGEHELPADGCDRGRTETLPAARAPPRVYLGVRVSPHLAVQRA
jgi:hypothetical protein